MDKAQLHEIPQVHDILVSPHFETILHFLREHISVLTDRFHGPEFMIHNAGKVEGWLACVNTLRDLKVVPPQVVPSPPRQQYQPRP